MPDRNRRSRTELIADVALLDIAPTQTPPGDLVDAAELVAELYRRITVAVADDIDPVLPDLTAARNLLAALSVGVGRLVPLLGHLADRIDRLTDTVGGDDYECAVVSAAMFAALTLHQEAGPLAVATAEAITSAVANLPPKTEQNGGE